MAALELSARSPHAYRALNDLGCRYESSTNVGGRMQKQCKSNA